MKTIVSTFEKAHGFQLPHSQELTNKQNPLGFFTRDGGFMRVEDNPDFQTVERTGAFAVVFAKNQMLLVTPPWTPKTLEISGGGIKNNETLDETILREITEELGITPNLNTAETFLDEDFYMNLTAEDAHRMFLKYTMIMHAINIETSLEPSQSLEEIVQQNAPTEQGNARYIVDINNPYDIDQIIQTHPNLKGVRLGHHHFIREAVSLYRQVYLGIDTTLTQDQAPTPGLIRKVDYNQPAPTITNIKTAKPSPL